MKTVLATLQIEYEARKGVTQDTLLRALNRALAGMGVAHQAQVIKQEVVKDSKMGPLTGLRV